MIHITRGIDLYLDTTSRILHSGCSKSVLLTDLPMRFWLTYAGESHPDTGLVVNVSSISQAVRQRIAGQKSPDGPVVNLMIWVCNLMRHCFDECELVRLVVDMNPSLSITVIPMENPMVYMTYKYELAASHRLINENWETDRNRSVFGKCANPSGHGHNYLLEVCLGGIPDAQTGQIADPFQVDQIIRNLIIEPFDHKNLNCDTLEFKERIPTVENMVQIFWHRLIHQFEPARLVSVKVWETSNTFAEFRG